MEPVMSNPVRARSGFSFPFYCCRNISGPEDNKYNRKVLAGHAPASSFLELEDDENVREYLVDAQGKQKRTPTLVHQAIRKTLRDNPEDFSILNSGICIVARGAEIDEGKKLLLLDRPSIINGSQTQGELRRYMTEQKPEFVPHVKFEIIVVPTKEDETKGADEAQGLVAEVAISRNFQNDVRAISIAGRRGQLNELEAALQGSIPDAKLRKSESDLSDDYIDSEKLIQVLLAVTPDSLWAATSEGATLKSRTFTYSQKTRCLKLFQKIQEEKDSQGYRDLYQFFLDVAGPAWKLYLGWKQHQGFRGTRLHSIQRTEDGRMLEVPDGIIFPIIAAYSAFCSQKRNRWQFAIPKVFDEKRLIRAASADYMDVADSNPQTMGKKHACYTRLLEITQLYAELDD
jgi:AIPR protein